MLLAHVLGDELDDLFLDVVVLQLDCRQAVLRAQKIGDLSIGDVAELRERVAEVAPALGLIRLSLFELLQADELFANEEFTEAVGRRIRHARSLEGAKGLTKGLALSGPGRVDAAGRGRRSSRLPCGVTTSCDGWCTAPVGTSALGRLVGLSARGGS